MLFGSANRLRERHVGTDLVEDEVQCATQHRLNLQYLVTRVAQVVDGSDDGQSSTHVGFIAEPHAAVARCLLQFDIVIIVARRRQLVGCYHADVMLQEGLVQACNLLAGGTIHEHAVKDVHLDDGVAQLLVGQGSVA